MFWVSGGCSWFSDSGFGGLFGIGCALRFGVMVIWCVWVLDWLVVRGDLLGFLLRVLVWYSFVALDAFGVGVLFLGVGLDGDGFWVLGLVGFLVLGFLVLCDWFVIVIIFICRVWDLIGWDWWCSGFVLFGLA